MKFSIFLAAVLMIALSKFSVAFAHDEEHDHDHGVRVVKPAAMYAPSAMPDRIILTLNEDPRTTQTVNWRTSVEVSTGLAEIAEAEVGPYFAEKAVQHTATSEALKTDLGTCHYHSFTFRDLKPGTTYAYRVGDGNNWSEWFHFKTATAEDSPFAFVYFGDAQNNVRSMWSRVIRKAYQDAPKAAFMLHAGDLINRANSDGEWGEWFGAGGWLNGMTPSIAIPGNHEHSKLKDADGNTIRRVLSKHWRKVFTFPENGPQGLEETCFTLTYHNLRIIGLNSTSMHEQQAKWLDKVLSENDKEWVVCTFHHPIFSTGKDRDNQELRTLWKPVLDKHQVDLVLQGHDHTYGRTGFDVPAATSTRDDFAAVDEAKSEKAKVELVGHVNTPTGKQYIDKENGTVYVVSVSGPKMYNNNRLKFMKRVAEDTQLYQIIHIDGGKLRFEARTAIGELYDAFELHKQKETINKLVEIEPEVDANLRPLDPETEKAK